MDEDVIITQPDSPSVTEELPPEPAPAETQPPVSVVPVQELVDLFSQAVQAGAQDETVPAADEPLPGEGGDVVVEDVVPGLIGDAIDLLLDIRSGMKNVESIERTVNHPMLTTPFQDYTVTEGLLLLMLLCFFIKACMNMVRRAFSWLL